MARGKPGTARRGPCPRTEVAEGCPAPEAGGVRKGVYPGRICRDDFHQGRTKLIVPAKGEGWLSSLGTARHWLSDRKANARRMPREGRATSGRPQGKSIRLSIRLSTWNQRLSFVYRWGEAGILRHVYTVELERLRWATAGRLQCVQCGTPGHRAQEHLLRVEAQVCPAVPSRCPAVPDMREASAERKRGQTLGANTDKLFKTNEFAWVQPRDVVTC
jgi:hypothetical protein